MKRYWKSSYRYLGICLIVYSLALFISCSGGGGGGGGDDDDNKKADLNGVWKQTSETHLAGSECVTITLTYNHFYMITDNGHVERFISSSDQCFFIEFSSTIEDDKLILYDDESGLYVDEFSYEILGNNLTIYPDEPDNSSCIKKEIYERTDSSEYETVKAECEGSDSKSIETFIF